jgi:RNA polymerase sigma-70 factor (ECF subfamily)
VNEPHEHENEGIGVPKAPKDLVLGALPQMYDRASGDPDIVLIQAAQKGDKKALQALLTGNWVWLRGLAYGVLGRTQDLDDIMQEICLRVITRIHTLRDPQCFKGWLAMVARREALKHCRRKWGGVYVDVDGEDVQLESPDDGPLEGLERRELADRVKAVVEELPQKYREVFLLAATGELTYAQMAEVLNVPITTMQIRLVRARRMIQSQVTEAELKAARSERKVND